MNVEGDLLSDEEILKIVGISHDKNEDPEYAMDIHALIKNGDDSDSKFDIEDWDYSMILKHLKL
jgi:hypothetical protein